MKGRFFSSLCAAVLAGVVLAGSASAQAPSKGVVLEGTIADVNRVTRTLTVVENVTGRVFTVQVPTTSLVGIEPTGSLPSAIPFAHVIRGLKFRAVVFATPKSGVSR